MADVKQIEVNGVTYDIHDAVARQQIASLQDSVDRKLSIGSGFPDNTSVQFASYKADLFFIDINNDRSNNKDTIRIDFTNGHIDILQNDDIKWKNY